MQFLSNAFSWIINSAIVLTINVTLFLILPAARQFFDRLNEPKAAAVTQRKLLAEYIKPKTVEQKAERKSRIRSTGGPSNQPLQNPMKFKFTPDLAVAGAGDGVAMQQEQLSAEVFEEGDVDENARPLSVQPPAYPDRAREMAIEGTVIVTFVVNEDGKVGTIEDIKAPHPSFQTAFRQSVQSWKFKPAVKKGVPVKQRLRWPVDYVLD